MPYHLLWSIWSSILALGASVVGLVSLVTLIIVVGSDPTRADVWVWGLAAAWVVGDLVGTASTPRRGPRGIRLAAVLWLAQTLGAAALILLASEAPGLMVLGYALAAGALVQLPDALGLWPGPITTVSPGAWDPAGGTS